MELLVIKGHQDKLSTPLKTELKKRGYHLSSHQKSKPSTITPVPIFEEGDNLWIRVHYFSNGRRNIHVVLKPLLDLLNQSIYHDDKQIVLVQGYDLTSQAYEIITTDKTPNDLLKVFQTHNFSQTQPEAILIIEIDRLPIKPSSFKVEWQPLEGF